MMRPSRANRVETNLVAQQEVFERAYCTLLNSLKHTNKQYVEYLRNAHSDQEKERKKEKENLQKSLLAIAMVIQKLKQNIKNEQFVKEHDTEYFKGHLTSIEGNLSTFKGFLSEQLHALQEEEKDLQQSIDTLQQRLNEMPSATSKKSETLHSKPIRERAKTRTCSQSLDNIHPDVKEFQQFLQNNGGHTGGWDAKDHLLFARFLQKYRGLDQMTTALLDFMPEKTPEAIAQHESWYHDYLTLKDAHRRALKEWRDEQISLKKKCDTVLNESVTTESSATVGNSKESHQKDCLVKEKIKKWKEQQQKLRQQQLQELEEKKKQEEKSWRKKVAYFEQQRKIISEKRKEHQKPANSGDLQEKSDDTQNLIKHIPLKEFWEQDKLFMQRRKSQLQRFSVSPHPRSHSQSTVHAERDPARLLQLTAVWRARVKRSLSEDGSGQSGGHGPLYIEDVPHLATPKWREGLV